MIRVLLDTNVVNRRLADVLSRFADDCNEHFH
jgi:hypothetical protein